jgi:hypothetical protein
MCLFYLFHLLRFSRRSSTPIDSYYFQHRAKGPSKYISALSPDKWDRWREDCTGRLELPTAALTARRSDWEKDPNLQPPYNPVLERIRFLAENGLMLIMVLHDYLSKCIAPLEEHSCPVWMYTIVNDTTRLQHGERSSYLGKLQPLPVPIEAWQTVSMHFIEGLPHSGSASCISSPLHCQFSSFSLHGCGV